MHSAGLLSDALIQNQSMEKFEQTMHSKVKGTWNLHLHTKHLPLEHFVLFSSGVALIGMKFKKNQKQRHLPAKIFHFPAFMEHFSAAFRKSMVI